jgi:hypothetical protein
VLDLRVLNAFNLFQSFQKVTFVYVVDNQLLETANSFCETNALLYFAVSLKHLENCILVNILAIFFNKIPELIFEHLDRPLDDQSAFWHSSSNTWFHLVYLLQLELDNPSAEKHLLWCI